MWPDNETTDDLIGFRVHAQLIRAVVTNPALLPTTIGVFGDWGGGKTSIMKMLEQELTPEHWPVGSKERAECEEIAVVYVNTWLFEGYDDAKAAMLSTVLRELTENKRFAPKLRDTALALIKRVNWMRVARFGMKHVAIPAAAAFVTGGWGLIPAAVAASTGLSAIIPSDASASTKEEPNDDKGDEAGAGQGFLKEAADDQMDIRTFRTQFKDMLKDAGIKTLVVLIDDLDRCNPERIIENLEAVKLFLSVDQTAFVIGADRRIVEHAIRARYAERALDKGGHDETDRLVKDYLEKLVQVPYSLPRLSTTEIETYMTLLFCKSHYDERQFAACLKACEDTRAKNRYASFGYAAVQSAMATNKDLGEALTLAAAVAPLIADGLKGNPRQVKRFLNALLLRKELAKVAKLESVRDPVLVKLMILEYVQPELFLDLFAWQATQNGHPTQLAKLEAALKEAKTDDEAEGAAEKIDKKWATSRIRRWISMEPPLKDVDLRDYFWVARDRLESTFAGISMVAPVVRTVIDDLAAGTTPKRNTAMATAKTLSADERASLLSLIEQRIIRQISDKTGFDWLRILIEADIPGAAETLAKILLNNPLESVPGNVGMELQTLIQKKDNIRTILEPALKHVQKSSTTIGRAAASTKK